jgi:hypothetical protein
LPLAEAFKVGTSTSPQTIERGNQMSLLGMILLIVLVMLLLGAFPSWGHSRNWGYGPSGGLGLVLVIVLILVLLGRI